MEENPLTLKDLSNFTQEVLLPAMDERFVGKKEFNSFKEETSRNFDHIFQKLDTILEEMEIRNHQEKKQKELWAITIKALKNHKIFDSKDLERITRLEYF